MNKFLKAICLLLAAMSLCMCAVSCDTASEKDLSDKAYYNYNESITGKGTSIKTMYVEREIDSKKTEDFVPSDKESDYVLISIKDYGDIVIVLREDVAPISVANFKKLVKSKFFNDTVFHRVIEHFMIQGGGCTVEKDKDGINSTFVPKESDSIYGEFSSNGFENNLSHIRGVISMARTNVPNSASNQFFIIHESNENSANLNNNYAAFGYVLAGMDVVDAIATCDVVDLDKDAPFPIEDVVIESVTFVEPKVALW